MPNLDDTRIHFDPFSNKSSSSFASRLSVHNRAVSSLLIKNTNKSLSTRQAILSELTSAVVTAHRLDLESGNSYCYSPIPFTIFSALEIIGEGTSFTARQFQDYGFKDGDPHPYSNIASALEDRSIVRQPPVVKVLHNSFSHRQGGTADLHHRVQAVVNEINILAHVPLQKHENILSLMGAVWGLKEDGIAWPALLVEFASAGNLRSLLDQHLSKDSLLDCDTKLNLCLDVTSGVGALHQCNIAHGDIKLENILVFADPERGFRAKLADLGAGIIGLKDSEAVITSNGWTEMWQAPEYRNTGTIGEFQRADLYSLGLLIWQVVLHGSSPFSLGQKSILSACREAGIVLNDDASLDFDSQKQLQPGPKSSPKRAAIMEFLERDTSGANVPPSRTAIRFCKTQDWLLARVITSTFEQLSLRLTEEEKEKHECFTPILHSLLRADPIARSLDQAYSLLLKLCQRKSQDWIPEPLFRESLDRGLFGSMLHHLNYEVILELPSIVRIQQTGQALMPEVYRYLEAGHDENNQDDGNDTQSNQEQSGNNKTSNNSKSKTDAEDPDMLWMACRLAVEGLGCLPEMLISQAAFPNTDELLHQINRELTFGTRSNDATEGDRWPRLSVRLACQVMSHRAEKGNTDAQLFLAIVHPALGLGPVPTPYREGYESGYYAPGPRWLDGGASWDALNRGKAEMLHMYGRFYGTALGSFCRASKDLASREILAGIDHDAIFEEQKYRDDRMALESPLHLYASDPEHFSSLESTLLLGSHDVNAKGPDGCTPLLVACRFEAAAAVALLLDHKADPKITSDLGENVFHYLGSLPGDEAYSFARKFAEAGADPSVMCRGREEHIDAPRWVHITMFPMASTPLHRAVTFGDIPTAVALLAVGADPHVKDRFYKTPLEYAILLNCTEIIEEIVEVCKVDLSMWHNDYGMGAWLCALRADYNFYRMMVHQHRYFDQQIKTLQLLQERNIDWMKNGRGLRYNCLQWAVKRSSTNVVDWLLRQPDLRLKEQLNEATAIPPPLMLAIIDANMHMAVLLLNHGAAVHIKDGGTTVLHLLSASALPQLALARILIQKGANLESLDNNSLTPFDVAIKHQNYEVADLLIQHGASVVGRSSKRASILGQLASRYDNAAEAFDYLLLPRHNGDVPSFITDHENRQTVFHNILRSKREHREQRKLFQALLKYFHSPAHINYVDANGFAPVGLAIINRNIEVFSLLLDAGAGRDLEIPPSPADVSLMNTEQRIQRSDAIKRFVFSIWKMDEAKENAESFTERESRQTRRDNFVALIRQGFPRFGSNVPEIVQDQSYAELMVCMHPELATSDRIRKVMAIGTVKGSFTMAFHMTTFMDLQSFFAINTADCFARNLDICIDMVKALTIVHDNGFTHGSLNPNNISIDVGALQKLHVQLSNFDYSAAKTGNPRSLKFAPHMKAYEAPETGTPRRNYGWTFDELIKIDNYALGVVLLYVCSNSRFSSDYRIDEYPDDFKAAMKKEFDNISAVAVVESLSPHADALIHMIRNLMMEDTETRTVSLEKALEPLLAIRAQDQDHEVYEIVLPPKKTQNTTPQVVEAVSKESAESKVGADSEKNTGLEADAEAKNDTEAKIDAESKDEAGPKHQST